MAPTPADTVLRWSGHGLLPAHDEPAGALLAADSWLVSDGAVRALDRHWARFGGWCEQLGVPAGELARFRAAVTAALPRGPGRWFPRVEAVAAGDRDDAADAVRGVDAADPVALLRLRLRAAPPAAVAVRIALAAPGDPRTRPRWKGPDLERLIALRAQAAAAGAGELLLCDDDGRLIEGALSSLLWWEDDVLCTTPDAHTLPGVTRALLLEIAGREGVAVRVRSPLPGELAECETWLTSALHGIRVVDGWAASTGSSTRAPSRAAAWRARLDRMARPLDDPVGAG